MNRSADLRIALAYEFKGGPWGGANQFLKALKEEFRRMDIYEDDLRRAKAVLFNSHHHLENCLRINKHPGKIFVLRLDGPLSLTRSKDKPIDRILKYDKLIKLCSDLFIDGIIYQSEWSRRQNKRLWGFSSRYETVIHNAADTSIFNREGKKDFAPTGKIKLIASHWSSDRNKGAKIYDFLDHNLDFSEYEMTFVGNSPVKFKRIKYIPALPSARLAETLKGHDIYITASGNDPCSNSLIEALNCGLPAVVLKDGGHPELLGSAGLVFNGTEDLLEKIDLVRNDYASFQSRLKRLSISDAAMEYYEFIKKIYDDIANKNYLPKGAVCSAQPGIREFKFLLSLYRVMNKMHFLYRKC